jgi:hypothetical protein
MNIWDIQDKIKRGLISYNIGDEVICFVRKNNGHPRAVKENVTYTITNIDMDGHLHLAEDTSVVNFFNTIRVHKIYMIKQSDLRDIKLNKLFETK